MKDEQYDAISGYLECRAYPDGFKKSQKFVLRRSYKGYELVNGKLYYKDCVGMFVGSDEVVGRVHEIRYVSASDSLMSDCFDKRLLFPLMPVPVFGGRVP